MFESLYLEQPTAAAHTARMVMARPSAARPPAAAAAAGLRCFLPPLLAPADVARTHGGWPLLDPRRQALDPPPKGPPRAAPPGPSSSAKPPGGSSSKGDGPTVGGCCPMRAYSCPMWAYSCPMRAYSCPVRTCLTKAPRSSTPPTACGRALSSGSAQCR